ncbi:MAG TPA: ribosome maturation factor RimM [Longimicrobiaceae bacterium]|nr:ribosome maturation factor RimM [Longimicrobiaceae bacterium]
MGGYLIVGTVQKPHGIRGELLVRLETDRPNAVFTPGRVLQLGDPKGNPVEGTVTVERARPFKAGLLVKTREHAGRSDAQDALRGLSLLMPADQAAPLDDGEVFYHELVGMKVTAAGEPVGTVRGWYESPAGFLLEVRGGAGKDILIPFVATMVRRVDRAERTMDLDVPAGLLDL